MQEERQVETKLWKNYTETAYNANNISIFYHIRSWGVIYVLYILPAVKWTWKKSSSEVYSSPSRWMPRYPMGREYLRITPLNFVK